MQVNSDRIRQLALGVCLLLCSTPCQHGLGLTIQDESTLSKLLTSSCSECHSGSSTEGQFSLDTLGIDSTQVLAPNFDTLPWEKILRKLRAGQMPPPGSVFQDSVLIESATNELAQLLDQREDFNPFVPPRIGLRRLTRTEYQNAIGDLLGLEIDAASLLPRDESSQGFDNITVSDLSPAYIGRAVQAALDISQQVFGTASDGPAGTTVRMPPERTQEAHVEGLPLGTRGGTKFDYHFPQSGRYEFQIRLMRDRDEKVEGLAQSTPIDILIDRKPSHRFNAPKPLRNDDHTLVDAHLNVVLEMTAGTHTIGVTFPQTGASLIEIRRQPFDAAFNQHRHPRLHPAIYEITLVGPLDPVEELIADKEITRSLFAGLALQPVAADQRAVASQVLGNIARIAYRRPLDDQDAQTYMHFFDEGCTTNFARGMTLGLASILVNPNFLLRVELPSPTPSISLQSSARLVPLSNLELASRLSFFLWSSLPDAELLQVAESGALTDPAELTQQVDRMLRDDRADALVTNFAAQWLQLRNLSAWTPDLRLYPDFDDNLRSAMRMETEELFRNVIRSDLSVMDLLRSQQTFLNERLAVHYDQPGILGSSMRRVDLPESSRRGGLLRHASILAVTSYATRTSPTIRGHWILENLIGTSPPPPPPNIPALKEKSDSHPTSTRERLALHRENPSCAACHNLMDPIGFALENYDAIGRWRERENDVPIETLGVLPDGTAARTVEEIELSLLRHPQVFVGTLIEKLATYGLGRGIELRDGPQIRRIVRSAALHDYRFSSIIQSIVSSPLFLLRSEE